MGLFEELKDIAEQIKKQRHLMTNEEATKTVSVRPFIRAFGYDINDLNEVQPEYGADSKASGLERVDYAIVKNGKPIVLIEAKAVGTTLSEKHWGQLHDYYVALDVSFAVLTNGIQYRLYTDHEKPNIMDKQPLLSLNILKPDIMVARVLEGFTKARFDPERTARELKMFNLMEREYSKPSNEFVRFFAKQIYSGPLFQKHIKEFAPIVRNAWRELVDREIATRLQRQEESEPSRAEVIKKSSRPKLPPSPPADDVVQVPIYGEFKRGKYAGHRFEAVLLVSTEIGSRQKVVLFQGEVMTPSGAVERGFQKAMGVKPSNNGWWFWKVTDPTTGKERPIGQVASDEDLRRRLMNK